MIAFVHLVLHLKLAQETIAIHHLKKLEKMGTTRFHQQILEVLDRLS